MKGRCSGLTRAAMRAGAARLYEDMNFSDSPMAKRTWSPSSMPSRSEKPDADYPLWLTTGRSKYHWHTMTRTGKKPRAAQVRARPDARDQSRRCATSRHPRRRFCRNYFAPRQGRWPSAGSPKRSSAALVFCRFIGAATGIFKAANNLTITARDPVSRQPELKACAVRVRKVLDFPLEDN